MPKNLRNKSEIHAVTAIAAVFGPDKCRVGDSGKGASRVALASTAASAAAAAAE